ncbi:centromere protein C-like [Primulina eburnea]|uniref:centromere protein C-like n=1 Tax=Primulina eburnea TaxID=1245227 RepID=UPI003C6BF703
MLRDRRQGFGLARKQAPFTLKTSLSQPISLDPSLDIDKLQDPDEFFDAYERLEKAKKEIQKQLGNSMDNVNEFKPSTKPRLRRQGILGKSYHYRHRYPSVSFENDMLYSQEVVEQHVPSVPRDEPAEKLITLNYNLNFDLDEIESVGEEILL